MTAPTERRPDGRDDRGFRSGLKRRLRRLRDARTRRALQAPAVGPGRAVLASTWDFPNPNHAFVYQEMLGLVAAGFDVRVFRGERRSARGLAARFRPLLRRAVTVETLRELHDADLAALERSHPGRVDAFLRRVGAALSRDVEDLRRDPLVRRAGTFARLVELAGARYLQSWFFYDQSFMTMFAAEVLSLPRGIACFTDHLLDDHPFKLVPLHLATADLVLATSERTRAELVRIGGAGCAPRILVKRIGVDGGLLRAARARPRGAGPIELVSVSRIEPKKGLEHLVEAAALLRQRGRRLVVRILGGVDRGHADSARCAADLRARIAALGVEDCVAMEGAVANDRVPGCMATATAFVAPYVELPDGDKDGIPAAVLEAMAAGLPVVCSDAGAIREAVTDGVEGLVVPQRDPAALAAAIERLLDDAGLRERLGRAAAARFDREFDCRVTEAELHRRVRGLVTRAP